MKNVAYFRASVVGIFLLFANSANAERLSDETQKGISVTAPIGGKIWERTTFDGVPGVVILASVRANWGSAELVDLPSGSQLGVLREKKLKVCQSWQIIQPMGMSMKIWNNCLIDSNDDGAFDKVSYNDKGFAKRLDPQVKYERKIVPLAGDGSQTNKSVIIFLGKSGSDIRLSYREFSNDMARPAFTEDLTLPAPIEFPQTMLVKNIKLTVLGIDGSGLRYRLD